LVEGCHTMAAAAAIRATSANTGIIRRFMEASCSIPI
jgi:hypothetical protein